MLVSSLVVFELEFVKWIEPLVFHCLCHLCFCFVKWLWNVKCWSGLLETGLILKSLRVHG